MVCEFQFSRPEIISKVQILLKGEKAFQFEKKVVTDYNIANLLNYLTFAAGG